MRQRTISAITMLAIMLSSLAAPIVSAQEPMATPVQSEPQTPLPENVAPDVPETPDNQPGEPPEQNIADDVDASSSTPTATVAVRPKTLARQPLNSEAPPSLTVNGQSNDIVIAYNSDLPRTAFENRVNYVYSSDSAVAVFEGEGCTGTRIYGYNLYSSGWSLPADQLEPSTYSVEARWLVGHNSYPEPGPCYNVSWVFGTPPEFTINYGVGALHLPLGEHATFQYSSGIEIGTFQNADCSGAASWGATLSTTSSEPTTRSYMARWANDTGTETDLCIAVTWADVLGEPPTLSLNGTTGDITIDVPAPPAPGDEAPSAPDPLTDPVSVLHEDGSEATVYKNAVCANQPSIEWGELTEVVAPGYSTTYSVQSRWIDQPSNTGPCYAITWNYTGVTEPPEIIYYTVGADDSIERIDGDITVRVGTGVQIQTPAGAELIFGENATCPPNSTSWQDRSLSPPHIRALTPQVYHAQARWKAQPSIVSDCVNINFVLADYVPILRINDDVDPVFVVTGTVVEFTYPSSAKIGEFTTEDCSREPSGGWSQNTTRTSNDPVTLYYMAQWKTTSSHSSVCIPVTWGSPPTLAVNGTTDSIAVQSGSTVQLTYSLDAEVLVSSVAGCVESDQVFPWGPHTETTSSVATVQSVTVRLVDHPHVKGPCYDIMYLDPPTLTLNDVTDHVTVPVQTPVMFQFPYTAGVGTFSTADCAGEPDNGWQNLSNATSSVPNTIYIQAAWFANTDIRSDCLQVTWFGAPTLTLNDEASNIDSVVGTDVTLGFPDGAEVGAFETADCSDEGTWSTVTSVRHGAEGVTSYQARWTDHPQLQSSCYSINWTEETPVDPPTLLLNGEPEDIEVEIDTTVWLEYPIGAEIVVFPAAATCEGEGNNRGPNFAAVGRSEEGQESMYARWTAFPEIIGECRTITWVDTSEEDTSEEEEIEDPIQQVRVVLTLSDGGSAEGGSWVLHASQAAQTTQAPYAEGVIAADNTFLLPELVTGQYRLEITAEGYEPVDIPIDITTETSVIGVNLITIQVDPSTPTPSPSPSPTETPSPSPSPTATPSPSPTVQPTSPPATPNPTSTAPSATPAPGATVAPADPTHEPAVTEFPSTGSGSGFSELLMMSLIATTLMLLGTFTAAVRRVNN